MTNWKFLKNFLVDILSNVFDRRRMNMSPRKMLLWGTNIFFFIFAYNLLRCASYLYAAEKGAQIKNAGLDAYPRNAFYFLILFVIFKSIVLLMSDGMERKKQREKQNEQWSEIPH